jgi:hypothetical protein
MLLSILLILSNTKILVLLITTIAINNIISLAQTTTLIPLLTTATDTNNNDSPPSFRKRISTCLSSPSTDIYGCTLRIAAGCPVRFVGPGCSTNSKGERILHQMDGGCEPASTCSFCCQDRCDGSQLDNPRCIWSQKRARCMTCWDRGMLYSNGEPITVGHVTVAPKQWNINGLGDSFFIAPECVGINVVQYASSASFWITSPTYGSQGQPPLPSTLFTRVIILHRISGFVLGDWQGQCHPYLEIRTGFYRLTCDFLHDGGFLTPSCGLPPIPSGAVFDLMFQIIDGDTYDIQWINTLPTPKCVAFQVLCGFQQRMAPALLHRTDFCKLNGNSHLYQNFAFELQYSKKGNIGCPIGRRSLTEKYLVQYLRKNNETGEPF